MSVGDAIEREEITATFETPLQYSTIDCAVSRAITVSGSTVSGTTGSTVAGGS